MRIVLLAITLASLCRAMEPAHAHRIYTLEGHSLILSINKQSHNHTVTAITYKEYSLYRHEEKNNGKKKISYIGSIELEVGYDEILAKENARKIFLGLMAQVRKLSTHP